MNFVAGDKDSVLKPEARVQDTATEWYEKTDYESMITKSSVQDQVSGIL